MKTAVVYYSLEGNTKHAANAIAKNLDADVISLVPIKKYPTGKMSKFVVGGKSATFQETPALEAYQFQAENYDLVLLGTPIWAGTFAPPLRTFLKENNLAGKNVAFFACCAGGSTEKCFFQLKNEIQDCNVVSTLRLIDPLKNATAKDHDIITEFCEKLTNA